MEKKTPKAVVSADKTTLTFYYDDVDHSEGIVYALNEGKDYPTWYAYNKTITTAIFDESFKDARPTTTYMWFSFEDYFEGYAEESYEELSSALTEVKGIENLNTSEVTNMGGMFYNCVNLKSLDVSNFDTSKVTNMSCLFCYCIALKSIDFSSFNTANVTDMSNMFFNCVSLKSLDVSSFNTTKVTDMYSMFGYCESLESLNISNFSIEKPTIADCMFEGCDSLKTIKTHIEQKDNERNINK